MAAVTAAVVEEFVRNLELSDMTHSIVKEKFRKHINKDSLTKEEKLQLKRAVEKALLENEEDESSDDDVPLSLTAELLRKQRSRNNEPHPTGEDNQMNDEPPVPVEKAGSRGGRALRRESPSPDPGDSEEEEEEEEEQVPDKPPSRTTELTPRRVGGRRSEGTGGSDSEGKLRGRSSGAERKRRKERASSESDSLGDSEGASRRPRNHKGPRSAPPQGPKPRGKRTEDSEEEEEQVPDKPPSRTTELTPRRVGGRRSEGTGGSDSEGKLRGRSSVAERKRRKERASSESDSLGDSEGASRRPRNHKGPRSAPPQGPKPRGKRTEDSEEEEEQVPDKPPSRTTELTPRRVGGRRSEGTGGSDSEGKLRGRSSVAERKRRKERASSESDSLGDSEGASRRPRNHKGPRSAPPQGPKPRGKRTEDSEEEEEQVPDKPPSRTTELTPRRVGGRRSEGTGGSDSEGKLRGRSSGAERKRRKERASSESDSLGDSEGASRRPRNHKGPRSAPAQGPKPRGKRTEDSEEDDSQASASGEEEGKRAGAQSSADESSGGEGSPSPRGQGQAPNGDSDSSSSSCESDGDRAKVSHDKVKKHKRKPCEKETRQEEHPTIKRLKRCIAACGVRRNYKKLFADCRSNKAKIRVLRQELEDLGIQGNPSLEKCKALRFKRDEEAELASLDVANIIHSEGRPRRQRAAAWDLTTSRPQSYKRTLPSDSEDEERPRKLTTWSNLQGLISDDCDSE